jgi:hypothetical protein
VNACQTGAGVNAAACIRAIDQDLSCQIGRDRLKIMTLRLPQEPHGQPRSSCAGKPLIELLWDALKEAYGDLLAFQDIDPAKHDEEEQQAHHEQAATLKGKCAGLATAIAIVTNPYLPDEDAVRADLLDRYEDEGALHNDGLEG